ncbi:MAG: T9SS type A sorting domain-containing protein, partial [Candidatus Latescibacteria bacterium]|nr:T9SS type A sorting domain-containing protein [Candidatus Latescibacterota bacterium]
PSNEASVGATTNVGNTPPITALTVLQNHPNPFAGSTDLDIGLPTRGDVSIQIYDVAGRVVREEMRRGQSAGWSRLTWDGRGGDGKPLASGVYFYRVGAAGQTVTRKMVIAR